MLAPPAAACKQQQIKNGEERLTKWQHNTNLETSKSAGSTNSFLRWWWGLVYKECISCREVSTTQKGGRGWHCIYKVWSNLKHHPKRRVGGNTGYDTASTKCGVTSLLYSMYDTKQYLVVRLQFWKALTDWF